MTCHRPFTRVGYAPALLQAAAGRPLRTRGEARLAELPEPVRAIVDACAAKHEVSVAELMAGSCQRKVVACRDEVNYRLHAMKPRATIDQIAQWLDRNPAGLMASIGRYAVRQRRKAV
jgi:hypothetical protein